LIYLFYRNFLIKVFYTYLAHNIEESRDYDPHSIAESQSSSNSISNGSSNMTNMTSESDNESSTNVKSKNINKNIMETDEMLDDDLKFGWNDDEPQNLGKFQIV